MTGCFVMVPTLLAHSSGPPARVTAAPGDDKAACTQCHSAPLNPSGGSVEIVLAGAATYTPGTRQRIQIKITDPAQKRWGFEFSARLNKDLANGQAGTLTSVDANTQTFCEDDSPTPCRASAPVQFIGHTSAGTRLGSGSPVTFEFDWTAPPDGSGNVTFYVAANAANGNGSPTGDHIYTASLQLTPVTSATVKPSVNSGGVVNAATLQGSSIAPASWVTIFGANLAKTTRTWAGNEIVGGKLPNSLDGISVKINGKAAAVEFISPNQINVLTPDDTSAGPVEIRVTTADGDADPVVAQLAPVNPGFFLYDGKYLAATHADAKAIGKPGLFPSAPSLTTPAKPGEVVILYGTGFGVTDPVMSAGQLVDKLANLVSPPQITVGGVSASVKFAGLIPGFAGLFQFNVELPATLADGDHKVTAQIGSVFAPDTSACCFITVQK